MEVYSIDEAWLNLTGFEHRNLDSYARQIVLTTHKNTGIPVSLGIGSTKVLAKVANRICKKHKIAGAVFNLGDADNLQDVLSSFEIGDVWGIGRRWAEKLKAQGIHTAWHLRQADDQAMRQQYNVVMQRIILELRGVHCLGFEDIEPKKQIIASRSFGERVTDKNSLLEAVALHATRAGEKLRLQGSVCGRLQVSIRSGKHNPNEPHAARSAMIKFPVATSDTRQLITAARQGVERIYQDGVRYAKAGVMAFDIVQADAVQQSFFGQCDNDRAVALMKTIDGLNAKYGRHTMKFAAEGIKKPWGMKRGHKTANFTTSWHDLPVAH